MKINCTLRRWCLPGLVSLSLCAPLPAVYAASIETGFSPEGTSLQLVLKTITTAQEEIRLMGYSFTSPEVAGALVRARQRGVDVKVVLDHKANTGERNKASRAAGQRGYSCPDGGYLQAPPRQSDHRRWPQHGGRFVQFFPRCRSRQFRERARRVG